MSMTSLAQKMKIVNLTVNDLDTCFITDGVIKDKNSNPVNTIETIQLLVGNPIIGGSGTFYYESYIIDTNNDIKWLPYPGCFKNNYLIQKIKDIIKGKSMEEIVKSFKE